MARHRDAAAAPPRRRTNARARTPTADDAPSSPLALSPRAARAPQQQWGRTYRVVLERLNARGDANAVQLYAWVATRYGHPENVEHPTRAQLARDLGKSVRTIQDAIKAVVAAGGATTIACRHPETGCSTGTKFVLCHPPADERIAEEDGPPPQSAAGCTLPPPQSAPGCTLDRARKGDQSAKKGGDQSAAGCTLYKEIRSVQIRRPVVVSTYLRTGTNGDNSTEQQQQQHPDPDRNEEKKPGNFLLNRNEVKKSDGDHGPPTVADLLRAFYTLWEVTHGAPYDRRRKDRELMQALVATVPWQRVFDALPRYFACTDVRIIGPDRLHPLGLLHANIGRLLATTGPPAGEDIWTAVLRRVATRTNAHTFHTWFRGTELVADHGTVIDVGKPGDQSEIFAAWIPKHYGDLVREALDAERPGTRVQFVTVPAIGARVIAERAMQQARGDAAACRRV